MGQQISHGGVGSGGDPSPPATKKRKRGDGTAAPAHAADRDVADLQRVLDQSLRRRVARGVPQCQASSVEETLERISSRLSRMDDVERSCERLERRCGRLEDALRRANIPIDEAGSDSSSDAEEGSDAARAMTPPTHRATTAAALNTKAKRKRNLDAENNETPLFGFVPSSADAGRPKRKLKSIARFDPHSPTPHGEICRAGEGFPCPRCAFVCSYDSRQCEKCQLECYYEAGVGVVTLKERNDIASAKKKPRAQRGRTSTPKATCVGKRKSA